MLHYCTWWLLILSFHLTLGLPFIFSNPNFCLNFPSCFSYVTHLIVNDFTVEKILRLYFEAIISSLSETKKGLEFQTNLLNLKCEKMLIHCYPRYAGATAIEHKIKRYSGTQSQVFCITDFFLYYLLTSFCSITLFI